jgi:hypothetical protein
MGGPYASVDRYIAPVLGVTIGLLTLLAGALMMWMSKRRRDPAMAIRAVGGLLGGTLLGLWAVGLMGDLFADAREWWLAGLSILLIGIGALLGWARSQKRGSPRGRFCPALARAVYTALIFAGIVVVWLVAPPGYQGGAALAAGLVFAICGTLVRRRRTRP